MYAYKDFHAYISMIKTCVTGLVLKDKNAQNYSKSSSFSLQMALMSL